MLARASVALSDWCSPYEARLVREVHNLNLGSFDDFWTAQAITTFAEACTGLRNSLDARIQALAEARPDDTTLRILTLIGRL